MKLKTHARIQAASPPFASPRDVSATQRRGQGHETRTKESAEGLLGGGSRDLALCVLGPLELEIEFGMPLVKNGDFMIG